MTEQQQIAAIHEQYCRTLTDLLDNIGSVDVQATFLKMTLDAVLRQFVARRGLNETSEFLIFVAESMTAKARTSLQ